MLERKINDIEIAVNTNEANDVYFTEEFSKKIANCSRDDILNIIYNEKKTIYSIISNY